MNVIRGRVEVKGNGLGVGDLLVVLFDIDPGTARDERGAGRAVPNNFFQTDGCVLHALKIQRNTPHASR